MKLKINPARLSVWTLLVFLGSASYVYARRFEKFDLFELVEIGMLRLRESEDGGGKTENDRDEKPFHNGFLHHMTGSGGRK
jgi:hypothetical protein